jgi:hypothetical protein
VGENILLHCHTSIFTGLFRNLPLKGMEKKVPAAIHKAIRLKYHPLQEANPIAN